jgi:two-component system, NtrC family, nitrogen regulation sensor histidine kinase NtrY
MLRVFNNLIKNGIQAIPDGRIPHIVIGLKRTGVDWTVSVSDNGSGIEEELRDRIFVPNFTTKTSGMGLGLAMVKNIVEMANGRIWFDSELGKGTTFYISFPAN